MVKVKNLEKKQKTATAFDKKNPGNRVKSINDDKVKKTPANKKIPAVEGSVQKDVKPLVKAIKAEAQKEIKQALKAKAALTETDTAKSPPDNVDVPDKLATTDVILKAVNAAKDGINKEKEGATAKDLFDDELRYGLQVIAVKIPKTPPHTKRIHLKHSLYSDEPDMCFIIRDGKKSEHDETIRKFQELLKEVGVTCVKTIITLSQLKKDYGPNNLKLKLLNTYDIFLVESEVAEHAYSILGKHFITKRKRPLQVDTSKKETIKFSIENARFKVSFKISPNSNMSIFEVGTHSTETDKVVENIESALEQLKEKWPGSWKNIMRLYLKPMKQSKVSIPIYYTKINPNDVAVPVEIGVKQSRLDKLSENLSKKSKRLRIDRNKKKIVKVTDGKFAKKAAEKPATEDVAPTEGIKIDTKPSTEQPKKKNKRKGANAQKEEVKDEKLPQPKKQKKNSESEVVKVESVLAVVPAKKQKKSSVSEAPVKVESAPSVPTKKQKKISESEATIKVESAPSVPAKKQKKSSVSEAPIKVEPGLIEASPAEPKKKFNKNAGNKKQFKPKPGSPPKNAGKKEPFKPKTGAGNKSPQGKKNFNNKNKGKKPAA